MSTRSLSARKLTAANYNSLGKILFVTSGLTQYFDAAKTNASGSTWTDLQGTGNMTLVSSPTISSGADSASNYVTFNGSSQYATGLSSTVNLSAFTFYLWIKTTSTADDANFYAKPTILGIGTNGVASRDYALTLGSGYIGFWSGLGASDQINQPSTSVAAVNDGNWHEIVVTSSFINGSRLYNNQNQVGSSLTVTQNTDATNAARFARTGPDFGPSYANFSCAVLAIYNRELSATERASNWNYFRSRYGQ